jgi:hypothetical protein
MSAESSGKLESCSARTCLTEGMLVARVCELGSSAASCGKEGMQDGIVTWVQRAEVISAPSYVYPARDPLVRGLEVDEVSATMKWRNSEEMLDWATSPRLAQRQPRHHPSAEIDKGV